MVSVDEETYRRALELVRDHQIASAPFLQRRLFLNWAKADAIIRRMEKAGVVGRSAGTKLRKIDMARLRHELLEWSHDF